MRRRLTGILKDAKVKVVELTWLVQKWPLQLLLLDILWTLENGKNSLQNTGVKSMEPFVSIHGIVAPMDRVNVDTDQIIPKQFLKRVERTGFGQFLFNDWRYNSDGSDNPEFVLN